MPTIKNRTLLLTGGALALAVLVTACGSGNGGESGSSGGPTPQGQPSFGANLQDVQQCLDAAGIKLPSRPSGAPSGFPSGAPSGAPSFSPGQSPPNGFGGGQGAGLLNSPKVQRALKACGIQLPTPPN